MPSDRLTSPRLSAILTSSNRVSLFLNLIQWEPANMHTSVPGSFHIMFLRLMCDTVVNNSSLVVAAYIPLH